MSAHKQQTPDGSSIVTDRSSKESAHPVAAQEKAAPGSAPSPDAAPSDTGAEGRDAGEFQDERYEDDGAVTVIDAEAVDGAAIDAAVPDAEGVLDADAEPDELTATAAERDRYLALAQRTQADFENYRKRSARETRAAEARGVARTTRELLPALDNLERAMGAAAQDDPLLKGVRLVHGELAAALARLGVESYSPLGEHFDPAEHEAMAQQPVPDAESGTVVEVYQAGYRLDGAVIRPARVVVAA